MIECAVFECVFELLELPMIEYVFFLVILSIKSCNTSWILDSCENPENFFDFPRLSKSGTLKYPLLFST
jgi:hypothetical protein